jgi:hypothetical protein
MKTRRRGSGKNRARNTMGLPTTVAVVLGGFMVLYGLAVYNFLFYPGSFTTKPDFRTEEDESSSHFLGPCSINLYGLPRKFKDLVLPSLVENVIKPNLRYRCDYFVHYYDRREERDYRGADAGRGGTIDPEEVKLLKEAVLDAHSEAALHHVDDDALTTTPSVHFLKETDGDFYRRYDPLLERIRTERGPDGNLLYMPLKEKTPFPNATIDNIIKMWHSQESVWRLMERNNPQKHYSRVAMLRSDVMYVTPIDIYQNPDHTMDHANEKAVIPDFSRFPVNDRMMYGPYDAVRIWAAGRFRRLKDHAESIASDEKTAGWGIHPERYLFLTIFPAIRDAGVDILSGGEDLCFLRVRSDASVRIGDCGPDCVTDRNRKVVERLIGRPCVFNTSNPEVTFLECNEEVARGSTRTVSRQPLTWEECTWEP